MEILLLDKGRLGVSLRWEPAAHGGRNLLFSLCSVLAAPICLQDGLVCRRRIVVISQVLALVRAFLNLVEHVASEET